MSSLLLPIYKRMNIIIKKGSVPLGGMEILYVSNQLNHINKDHQIKMHTVGQ